MGRPMRVVTLESLEAAPTKPMRDTQRYVVSDPQTLQRLCTPLGPRLGLLQIKSARDWELLRRLVPEIGPCPDLTHGTMIGLACWAGTPLDGRWPIDLQSIQLRSGGGLISASFHGGTYLPDGTARLETTYVKGLNTVLVVDVDGTSFYPTESS